ncbi:uncharacterized protein [Aegilops tauschii subsp. strangulata]|uniref:uncharacterized protein n=1 Tax=Aegilops tauschii subsp. strangulata TaxID=200361 RepID=UPI003CC8BE15
MSRSPPRQDSVSYQIIWLLWTWRPLVTFLVLINSLLLKYYCVASGRAPLLDYQRRGCATGLSPRATATAAVISPVGGGLVHDHVTSAVALGGCPRPPPLLRGARQAQRLRAGQSAPFVPSTVPKCTVPSLHGHALILLARAANLYVYHKGKIWGQGQEGDGFLLLPSPVQPAKRCLEIGIGWYQSLFLPKSRGRRLILAGTITSEVSSSIGGSSIASREDAILAHWKLRSKHLVVTNLTDVVV